TAGGSARPAAEPSRPARRPGLLRYRPTPSKEICRSREGAAYRSCHSCQIRARPVDDLRHPVIRRRRLAGTEEIPGRGKMAPGRLSGHESPQGLHAHELALSADRGAGEDHRALRCPARYEPGRHVAQGTQTTQRRLTMKWIIALT